jgi:hypothetical protein
MRQGQPRRNPCKSVESSQHLNTPFKKEEWEEVSLVEITDPSHPLFGRRFPVVFVGAPFNPSPHVFVTYRENIVLRIPVSATNLVPPRAAPHAKFTLQALDDLILLAKQCEVLCMSHHETSGDDYPQGSNNKLLRISRRSSRR